MHLSGYNVTKVKRRLVYNSIKYGDKLVPIKKKTLSSGKLMWFTEIDLSRMRGRYLLITANNSEYEMDSNAIIISTSSRIKENSDEDGKYVPSGVVILCSCILDDQINNTG